jgi:hypothetical protein
MDAFVKYYEEQCPEVPLYLKYLEKADPAKYKKFCDGESISSYHARIMVSCNRDRAERLRKESPEYKAQLKSIENARLHKQGQSSDPDYYICKDAFKNGYPGVEINALLTKKETRPEGLRLINKAVLWNMMDASSQVAKTAADFVRAESSYSADPAANAKNVWSELMPEGDISAEDRHHIDLLWSGKYPKAAELEKKLKTSNPAEHARLRGLAQLCDVVPKDRTIPMYDGPSMTPNSSRFGSPAFAAEKVEADKKWEKLREKQRNSNNKNPMFRF